METTLEEMTASFEQDARALLAEAFAECETKEEACRLYNAIQDAIMETAERNRHDMTHADVNLDR